MTRVFVLFRSTAALSHRHFNSLKSALFSLVNYIVFSSIGGLLLLLFFKTYLKST